MKTSFKALALAAALALPVGMPLAASCDYYSYQLFGMSCAERRAMMAAEERGQFTAEERDCMDSLGRAFVCGGEADWIPNCQALVCRDLEPIAGRQFGQVCGDPRRVRAGALTQGSRTLQALRQIDASYRAAESILDVVGKEKLVEQCSAWGVPAADHDRAAWVVLTR
jgi:hypothetical protein